MNLRVPYFPNNRRDTLRWIQRAFSLLSSIDRASLSGTERPILLESSEKWEKALWCIYSWANMGSWHVRTFNPASKFRNMINLWYMIYSSRLWDWDLLKTRTCQSLFFFRFIDEHQNGCPSFIWYFNRIIYGLRIIDQSVYLFAVALAPIYVFFLGKRPFHSPASLWASHWTFRNATDPSCDGSDPSNHQLGLSTWINTGEGSLIQHTSIQSNLDSHQLPTSHRFNYAEKW